MPNYKKKEKIDEFEFDFALKCAEVCSNVSMKEIKSGTHKREAYTIRAIMMRYFRNQTATDEKGAERKRYSLDMIGKPFGRHHATVMHAVETIDDFISIGDKHVIQLKEDFENLISNYNSMELLLQEAARRQKIRDEEAEAERKKIELVDQYRRKYNKVMTKLIRTVEMPPSKRDFDLLDHVLNY